MDDLFTILIIAFLIVGPLLEKLLKGKRPQPPAQQPQRRRHEPAERRRLPDGRTTTVSGTAEAETAGSGLDATDLLPAELWEVLTGQRREPPRRAEPEPQAEEAEPAPARVGPQRRSMAERRAEVERKRAERMAAAARSAQPAELDEEAAASEVMRRRERTQAARRRYDHSTPAAVSLETEPASESIRHAAFHEKLDRLPRPPARRRQAPAADFDLDLGDQAALQRAVLIQEVLGRPKGLD